MSNSLSGENNPMYGRTGENHPMYGRTGALHPMYGRTGANHPMYGKVPTHAMTVNVYSLELFFRFSK
jgi:hypothetical protein